MKNLIDNGHGIDTPGKRSPDGVLREYAWNRMISGRVVSALTDLGHDATGWCAFTTRGDTRADALYGWCWSSTLVPRVSCWKSSRWQRRTFPGRTVAGFSGR